MVVKTLLFVFKVLAQPILSASEIEIVIVEVKPHGKQDGEIGCGHKECIYCLMSAE